MAGRKIILLVDDDPVFCELTQELFEEIGCDLVGVSETEEARRVFFEDPHRFDLILLDHVLSDIHGEELAADFLSVRFNIPIALYTGADVSLEAVRSKGVCAVIKKPLTKSELAAAIERILRGG